MLRLYIFHDFCSDKIRWFISVKYCLKIFRYFSSFLLTADTDPQALTDFLVTVSDDGFPVTFDQLSTSFPRCGQYTGYPLATHWGRVTCSPEPVRGRYVYVSTDNGLPLIMCEVRVLGGEWLIRRCG